MKKNLLAILILALTAMFVVPCTLTAKWNTTRAVQYLTRTVKGRVTGPDGEPISGVSIVAKGATGGTTTDMDGYFSLEVPVNCTILIFTFIGYKSQEVEIPKDGIINVQLQEEAQM